MKIHGKIFFAFIIFMSSCFPNIYDKYVWEDLHPEASNIDNVKFYLTTSSIFSKGSWLVWVAADCPVNRNLTIIGARFISNEGATTVYSGRRNLPLSQQKNNHWTGQLAGDETPIKISPLFYESQMIKIEIEVSIDGESPRKFYQKFKARHYSGSEIRNLLTE